MSPEEAASVVGDKSENIWKKHVEWGWIWVALDPKNWTKELEV